MGKNLKKELERCKHPNSRRIKQLSKKAKRMNNKQKSRLGHAVKCNILGEKLNWFLDKVGDRTTPLTSDEFQELLELYLKRFDDEMEQIKLKQSISKNRSHQHVARENVIKITLERECGEYNGGGMEFLNLCDPIKYKSMIDWDGNGINVQHLKLDLISKGFLQRLKAGNPSIIVTECSDEETAGSKADTMEL